VNIVDLFQKGGLAMWPILVLSVLSLGTIFERLWFWSTILRSESQIADQILAASRRSWQEATHLARQANNQPIGRFMHTPLKLANQEPEIFRLALEASADEELNAMQRGNKILEATIALSPLLGLLGTVLGLIDSLRSIRLGDIGTTAGAGVTLGISAALISTAAGLIVAIVALAFFRIFQGLLFQQARIFRSTGNELELIYRQSWLQNQESNSPIAPLQPSNPLEGFRGLM
jgi:biopolymer transport protein ExbB